MITTCPQCHSRDDIVQTSKFDGTNIDPDECVHDFECGHCGCLFNIYFAPVKTKVYERGTLLDPEPEPVRKGSGKNFRVQKLYNPKEQVGMPNTHKWAVMSDAASTTVFEPRPRRSGSWTPTRRAQSPKPRCEPTCFASSARAHSRTTWS